MSSSPSDTAGFLDAPPAAGGFRHLHSRCCAGFVALAFLNNGFPNRLPEYLLPAELARRTNTPRDECFRNANSTKTTTETYCSFGSEEAAGKPSAILWGDLFANQYLRANFFGGVRQRDSWADRDAKRLQGLHRGCSEKFGGSAGVPGIQPQHAGLRAGPTSAEHHCAWK